MIWIIRRILFGRPLPTSSQHHERLSKFFALPVFASDALSSTAYATEEILLAFAAVGALALSWTHVVPITLSIVALLWIVVVSYRLTIFSYPQGGGSFIVSKENLGVFPGLTSAAALLGGYVLTVAVSIAAGIAAVTSAFPVLEPNRVILCIAAIGLVALMNLRGLRESGVVFAIPTYTFVLCIAATIAVGLYNVFTGDLTPVAVAKEAVEHREAAQAESVSVAGVAFMLLILRAFSSGCAAMTGVEAVADGVQAFKPPESRNAAATLVTMAGILTFMFIGISMLAKYYQIVPMEGGPTVVSQIAGAVFGRGWFYYAVQAATTASLILAANTAYQDFPRLSSILARARFAPRQFASIGDRLVFSNGIIVLSVLAGLLIWIFGGSTHALMPLYAVGVFIAFTMSQWGMSARLRRLKGPHWRLTSGISAFGAFVTGVVAVVVATMRFASGPKFHIGPLVIPTGAYIVVLFVIPLSVYALYKMHQHYITLGDQLRLTDENFKEPPPVKSTSILLTSSIHKGILPALEYAKTLSHDCRALFVEVDPVETSLIRDRWEKFGLGVPLVILESPYRSMIAPVLNYLEEVKKERPNYVVTVVLPEFVPRKWWHKLLHNQSGLFLKIALMMQKDIVFTNVRYYVDR